MAVAYLLLRAGLGESSISRLLGIPYPTVRRLSKRTLEHRDFMNRLLDVLLNVHS